MTGDHNGRINDYCAVAVYGWPLGFNPANTKLYDEVSTTLCNGTRPGYCNGVLCIQGKAIGRADKNAPNGSGINTDKSFTLNTVDKHAVVYAIDRAGFNQGINARYDFEITDNGINSTLVAKGPSAVAYEIEKWIVRRLTPARLEYAKKMLNENNITYKVCNEQTGQINCFLSNGQIMIFYAGTGKIKGYEHARGIHNFVKLCQRKELSHAENGRN